MTLEKETRSQESDPDPRCELVWEDGRPLVACETAKDQKKAAKAFREHEVTIRVKVREE